MENMGNERSIVVFKSSSKFMSIKKVTLMCRVVHIHAQKRTEKALTVILADYEVLCKQEVKAKKEL